MLPAFGRQREAGGRGDEQESGVLITGVDQRIEAAIDERVVHRTDREDARTGEGGREAGRAEQEKEVLLGNSELDMLAVWTHAPTLSARELGVAENIVAGVAVEHA